MTKVVLAGSMALLLACGGQSPAPAAPPPAQVVAPAPVAAEPATVEPAAVAPVVAEAPPAPPPAPVPSTYTIDGVSLSTVSLAQIEKALKKVGCKKFDERTTQTIGPYEYLSTRCQLKREVWRNTTFSMRRPALKPETTTIDPEPYSPAHWQKNSPGELWDEPANVYADVLIHADNASELSRPLFESVVKKR